MVVSRRRRKAIRRSSPLRPNACSCSPREVWTGCCPAPQKTLPHGARPVFSQTAWLNPDFLGQVDTILADAEKFSVTEAVRFRVQVARLPISYVQLATNRISGDARPDLLRHSIEIARKAKISNISEGQSPDDWAN